MTSLTVLVTGAASGIGRASVHDLLRHGHRVVATDLDRAALDAAHAGGGDWFSRWLSWDRLPV